MANLTVFQWKLFLVNRHSCLDSVLAFPVLFSSLMKKIIKFNKVLPIWCFFYVKKTSWKWLQTIIKNILFPTFRTSWLEFICMNFFFIFGVLSVLYPCIPFSNILACFEGWCFQLNFDRLVIFILVQQWKLIRKMLSLFFTLIGIPVSL